MRWLFFLSQVPIPDSGQLNAVGDWQIATLAIVGILLLAGILLWQNAKSTRIEVANATEKVIAAEERRVKDSQDYSKRLEDIQRAREKQDDVIARSMEKIADGMGQIVRMSERQIEMVREMASIQNIQGQMDDLRKEIAKQ